MLPCHLGRWSDWRAHRHREGAGRPRVDHRGENAYQGSPYYQINPSGRVPYLVDDAGVGMEDSQLICAYLDNLTVSLASTTRYAIPIGLTFDSSSWRAACATAFGMDARMCRPASERSPTVLAHEVARSQRMADIFESYMADPLMRGPPRMAHLILAAASRERATVASII